MLLIYSEHTSTRLQYTCKFIFEEMLGVTYSITLHRDSFLQHDGPKINYSDKIFGNIFQIKPHHLLFEEEIKKQQVECFSHAGYKAFFETGPADYPFDIFAAVFFLISRYEEYLPHSKDSYGRYAHENSTAFREGFLDIPLVNIWVQDFGQQLTNFFAGKSSPDIQPSTLNPEPSTFHFLPTYDIDMAWSYKEKGWVRNLGGFLRKPSFDRIASLFGMRADPFDSYRFLHDTHGLNGLKPLYFFLVAEKNSVYDKNISPANASMRMLVKEHAQEYEVGLHPSWRSNDNREILMEEKACLEEIAGKNIFSSRQHYIKFALPETFQKLIAAGITDDYSLGYGSINGFRASVAASFYWYDLQNEQITSLRLHPFCFMDANCFYEQKLSLGQSYDELMHYFLACKNVNGKLITIFHNNFLGTDKFFQGWREFYTRFIAQVQ